MFSVTQLATEKSTNCGARRAASRVLTRFFTQRVTGFKSGFVNMLSIVVIDMASLEHFELPRTLNAALFGSLDGSQRTSLMTVLNEGFLEAHTDSDDESFQARVNREVQIILSTLHFHLTGDRIVSDKELVAA